jgi:hypothetical protein
MVFVVFWVGVGCFRAGQIHNQIANTRDMQRRQQQLLIAPWQKPGPTQSPSRVSAELTLLKSHPPIEEDEAA